MRLKHNPRTGLTVADFNQSVSAHLTCDIAGPDSPNIAYATVYPVTTLMRILSAQILVVILLS